MFKWKTKATNAIYLKDDTDGKGRPFEARFLEAGLVQYSFGLCLLTKDVINKFVNGFVGCPVVIDHAEVTEDNAKDLRCGVISDVWFNESDGWFWCKGIIFDKEAISLIEKGYNCSCQYEITEYKPTSEKDLHNGVKFDKFILNGKPEHLAIVKNPRYENAYIAVNAIEIKAENKQELQEAQNKGDEMGLIEDLKNLIYKAENKQEEDMAKCKNEKVDKRKIIDEIGGILDGKIDEELWRTVIGKAEKLAYDESEAGTADNEDDEKEEAKNKKAKNERVDKRDLIRQIMAIAGKHEDNEDVRTIAKLAEKLAYDKSEAGTADNKCKNKDDEGEYEYEELKEEVEKEAENKKAKNSMEDLFYIGKYQKKPSYITQKQAIELGKKLF